MGQNCQIREMEDVVRKVRERQVRVVQGTERKGAASQT